MTRARHASPPYAEVVRFVWHARPLAIQGSAVLVNFVIPVRRRAIPNSARLVRYVIRVRVVILLSVQRVRFVIPANRRATLQCVRRASSAIVVNFVSLGNNKIGVNDELHTNIGT